MTGARGWTALEAAVAVALGGTVLAVAVPVFSRELHASHLVEATSGLERLAAAAVAHAERRRVFDAFPPAAPLTPAAVPRGRRSVDAEGTWDAPTWRALAFRAAPEGAPHAFAFAFDIQTGEGWSAFVGRAHGDLDGDGHTSTFSVRGEVSSAEPAHVVPGMPIDAELE